MRAGRKISGLRGRRAGDFAARGFHPRFTGGGCKANFDPQIRGLCHMLTEAEIYAALNEIFRDVFMLDELVVKAETSAKDVPDWDSFRQIEIIAAIEQRFAMKFTTRDLDGLQNVGDLVRVVAGKAG